MDNQIKALCDLITAEQQDRLEKTGLSCEVNMVNAIAHSHIGKKYIRIDIGTSGKYMINEAGEIFGIKAYGVINKKKQYGNINTINDYYWGHFTAVKKQGGLK